MQLSNTSRNILDADWYMLHKELKQGVCGSAPGGLGIWTVWCFHARLIPGIPGSGA